MVDEKGFFLVGVNTFSQCYAGNRCKHRPEFNMTYANWRSLDTDVTKDRNPATRSEIKYVENKGHFTKEIAVSVFCDCLCI